MQQGKKILVACPQCGKEIIWGKENLFRPFCSERCKLIDLGQWANERYRIPEKEQQTRDQTDDISGQA